MTAGNIREHIVELGTLGSDRVELKDSFESGEIDFSPEGLSQTLPIAWSGFVERSAGEVRLCGRLDTVLEVACVRCLEPVGQTIEKRFDLFFRQRDSLVYDEDAEIELTESDMRTSFFTGSELPLGEIVREQILLAIPMKSLCKPDCRGLCPSCGTNRNAGSCQCPEPVLNPAFDTLLEFKKQLEERSS